MNTNVYYDSILLDGRKLELTATHFDSGDSIDSKKHSI